MIIQHNIMAMGAYRSYAKNTNSLNGNLEKLASGYRINRAGDDAAGLAISEKMRAQITGLDAAQKNVQDGISLVQTAEGALQEVQDTLNRMVYLATQSANGTYDDEVDRANLQKEVDALRAEIDRIADSSNFNGINLLDGSMCTQVAVVKDVQVAGIDRMLSDIKSSDEKVIDVVGKKTVLDAGVDSAGKATVITLDFTELEGTIAGTTGTANELAIDFTIGEDVFSVAYVGTSDGAAATVAAADIAADLVDVLTDNGNRTTVELGGIEYEVTDNGDGTITLEMTSIPTTDEECAGNLDIAVAIDEDNSTGGTGTTLSGTHDAGTRVEPGSKVGGADRANTVIEITAEDIRDGAYIRIGDAAYTLKVGANSSTEAGANVDGLIDLSMMEEDDIDLDLALSKISEAFGSTVDDTSATDTEGKPVTGVTLAVTVTNGEDGHPIGIGIRRSDDGATNVYTSAEKLGEVFSMKYKVETEETVGLTLQIGDTSAEYNQITVDIQDMHVEALGLADVDIGTREGAQSAVDVIKDAINYVSSTRGTLGATQNRLEHTASNLAIMEENIQDAESSIRDTDMAEEMMAYTKNNILIQSAQAMLAQAKTVPQGVLQLLQ